MYKVKEKYDAFVYYVLFKNQSIWKVTWYREQQRCRDCQMPRVAPHYYKDLTFLYMYESGNNKALLHCFPCDHHVFSNLLHLFGPEFDSHTLDDNRMMVEMSKDI